MLYISDTDIRKSFPTPRDSRFKESSLPLPRLSPPTCSVETMIEVTPIFIQLCLPCFCYDIRHIERQADEDKHADFPNEGVAEKHPYQNEWVVIAVLMREDCGQKGWKVYTEEQTYRYCYV